MFSRQQPPSSLPTQPSVDSLASHPLHLPSPRYKGKIPCKETPWGHCSLSHLSPVCQSSECIIKFILKRKSKFLITSKVRRSHILRLFLAASTLRQTQMLQARDLSLSQLRASLSCSIQERRPKGDGLLRKMSLFKGLPTDGNCVP